MIVVFRCDATASTGLGHLSRCVALAEAFGERGLESVFAGRVSPHAAALLAEARLERVATTAVAGMVDLIHTRGAGGVVLDGYGFDAEYVEGLGPERTGAALLVLDDYALLPRYPDGACIVNFTAGASSLRYEGNELTLLLGPAFLPVRRAIREVRRGRAAPNPNVERVMVAIGGVDRSGLGARVVRALSRRPGLTTDLVERTPASKVASALAEADVVISGGGLMKYEAAYTGLPVAALSQTVNEHLESKLFAAAGLGFDIGLGEAMSDAELAAQLDAFLDDQQLLAALRAECLQVFPEDPTGAVADVFYAKMTG